MKLLYGENRFYLVDLSYIIYYSTFSTFPSFVDNYEIRKSELRPEYDPSLDIDFVTMLEQNIINNILKPLQYNTTFINKDNIILCDDCSRRNNWRREIFPDYKMNRDAKDKSKERFNSSKVMNYAKQYIVPNICDKFNCIRVLCECAEGDDIIAILSKKILKESNNYITILSSDRDMIQLSNDRVTIITATGEIREPNIDMAKMTKKKLEKTYTATDFLLFKILLGDSSDNIPNICRGVGVVKALNLVNDKQSLMTLIKSDDNIKNNFYRNSQLISMEKIPNDVSKLILESYEEEISKRNII